MEQKTNKEWRKEADQLAKKLNAKISKVSGRHDAYRVHQGDKLIAMGRISDVVKQMRDVALN